MKQTFFFLCIAVSLLAAGQVSALTPEEKEDVLIFAKDYILLESKNSGIFEMVHPVTREKQWFELYGILGEVRSKGDVHTVILDVDIFGYPSQNYFVYFDIQKKKNRWVVTSKRLGPQHQREQNRLNGA